MYIVRDLVETGHHPGIGGTFNIGIHLNTQIDNQGKKTILDIIDRLDHCLITTSKELSDISHRYFLLDNSSGLYHDIVSVLYYLLKNTEFIDNVLAISIEQGNIIVTEKPGNFANVLSCKYKD